MTSQTTRRKFLEQTTHSAAVVAAATSLGGVHAVGAEKPTVARLGISDTFRARTIRQRIA